MACGGHWAEALLPFHDPNAGLLIDYLSETMGTLIALPR